MKSTKKTKQAIVSISCLILCAIIIWLTAIIVTFFAPRKPIPPLERYSERWEITFPEDATVDYKYSNQGGWFGEGKAYTVIKFDKRPDELLQSFENQKSDAHPEEYSRITNELLEEGMDENRLIALSDEFLYKRLVSLAGMDILILVYDENTDTLYYFEELK